MLKQKSICLKINARKSINKGNQGKNGEIREMGAKKLTDAESVHFQ